MRLSVINYQTTTDVAADVAETIVEAYRAVRSGHASG